jgi:DNA-binding XRE family transcriptional regulator
MLGRLRAPDANPRLEVAERVAAALGVPVESVWSLIRARRR